MIDILIHSYNYKLIKKITFFFNYVTFEIKERYMEVHIIYLKVTLLKELSSLKKEKNIIFKLDRKLLTNLIIQFILC